MTTPDIEGRSFLSAARFIRRLITKTHGQMPPHTLLNINFPRMPPGGYKQYQITRLGKRVYKDIISTNTDPRGKSYFWIGGEPTWERTIETDAGAVGRGLVSITPLNIDMTDEALLAKMRTWKLV
jgi:5'-nucleotidase